MFNTLFNFLTDFISLNMNFFNFHHHNPQISYGIYNSTPEEKIPEHYFSVGIHPQNIHEQWENDLENLKIISQNPKCLAIGECGLDALVNIDENLQKNFRSANSLGKSNSKTGYHSLYKEISRINSFSKNCKSSNDYSWF